MEMEMEMDESPTKVMGNYSDDSNTSFDSSDGIDGLFSRSLKRLRRASTDTTTTVDGDTDSKTSSTRSSISEELDGPLMSQPSDLLQAVILASTRTTSAADDDTDSKTSSTRSSISEELGGPLLSLPSEPLQTAVGEEIGKRRCTTLEEYAANDYSWEECKDFLNSIAPIRPGPQPNTETFEVDPNRLAAYARQALKYFEETTGEVYRYDGPRSMCLCSLPDSEYKVTHINFFATPDDKFSESLFFAAVEHGPVRKVLECCIVPLFKAGDGDVPFVKHPPHVDCSECSKFGDAVLCFEVEEEPCCMPWSSFI